MNGHYRWQKFSLSLIYLIGLLGLGFLLVWTNKGAAADLTGTFVGLGTFGTGLATGLAAFMWGNSREHSTYAALGAKNGETNAPAP